MNDIEEQTESYILQDVFETLCKKNGIKEEFRKEYLDWLKDIGVIHYYKAAPNEEPNIDKEKYAVLKPEWLTNGIYRIINRIPEITGLIPITDLYKEMEKQHENDVFPDIQYNASEVGYILFVMRLFNISFQSHNREFIPSKLRKQTQNTPNIEMYKSPDSLHLCWENKYLPLNLFHRLMIEKFTQLNMDCVWRYGVIFNSPNRNASALIELDINETSLDIYVKSDCGEAKEYLSEMRGAINTLLEKMCVQCEEFLRHRTQDGREGKISYEIVRQHHIANMDKVYDMTLGAWFSAKQLLKLYDSDESIEKEAKYNNCDMRKIEVHQYAHGAQSNIDSPGSTQNNYFAEKVSKFPETITEDECKQFVEFLHLFLSSEEGQNLRKKDYDFLKNEADCAEKEDKKNWWNQFREYLADTANITTIATPLAAFATANGDKIAKWIIGLFS